MATPPPTPDLWPTLGVVFIGIIISSMLYGVTFLQTALYYMNYQKDPTVLKVVVLLTLIVDTVHEGILIHAGYFFYIDCFANPVQLAGGVWSIVAQMIFNSTAAFLVECYMTWRLHILSSGNYYLSVPAMAMTLAHLGGGYAWSIRAFLFPSLAFEHLKELTSTAAIGLIIGSVTDVYITGGLVYFLFSSRTGFKKSNDMIARLIQYVITTGVLTSLCNIITLAVYVKYPDDFYHMFFSFMIPKLYINSLLATLNSRDSLRNMGSDHISMGTMAAANSVEVRVGKSKFTDTGATISMTEEKSYA